MKPTEQIEEESVPRANSVGIGVRIIRPFGL